MASIWSTVRHRSLVAAIAAMAAFLLLPGLGQLARAETVVYTSGADVGTWDPIYPLAADADWGTTVCKPGAPAVGLNASWTNPHNAYAFGTGAHPWQWAFTGNWINAWSNLSSQGPNGQSWTKYSLQVSGTGDFVLQLLADNCSWIYLDGTLVGFQDDAWSVNALTYPVTLTGTHTLEFIIFDGGGLAGGMFRLETNTNTVFIDTDNDGLANVQETGLYGTNPNDPDTDDDGVNDGDEVAAGTDPTTPDGAADSDGDGVGDNGDPFPNSNLDATVVIGGCNSGVGNQSLGNGATFNDMIGAAAVGATNHGAYVSAVTKLADGWKKSGLISGRDQGKITSCAARSSIP